MEILKEKKKQFKMWETLKNKIIKSYQTQYHKEKQEIPDKINMAA